jgi:hypothetical protein
MTTINDISDLVRILRENPDWAEAVRSVLLTQELLSFPERFNEFVELTRENNELVNRRLERLEEGQQRLERDVAELKSDVVQLKTDVGALNGNDTERRARENILNIAKDELDLSRGSILLARGRDTASQFLDSIEEAEAQGLITEDQADHVLLADIIIRARRGEDRQYVHGVFEVSRTIRLNDIRRARDRADAVAAATKEETIAAVIGGTIQPPQRTQAEEMNVQVLIPAMFSPSETGEEPAEPASP